MYNYYKTPLTIVIGFDGTHGSTAMGLEPFIS